MVCTFVTVQVSYFDLGGFNAVAALVIAVIKAIAGRCSSCT